LIGRVAELSRKGVSPESEDLAITLEAELQGRLRNVRVPLDPDAYDWAIYAHQHRLPFTVSGVPNKRRGWELIGAVEADVEFLRARRDGAH
jgi:hypothetical protein